jgi:L-seryl-tRNA(Ser) seleniumtransferase
VPRTDAVLGDARLDGAIGRLGRALVREAVTAAQQRVRAGELRPDEVVPAVLAALPAVPASLRPVLNATGVLLHTNLGRAPLSVAARSAVLAAAGTTDVELDLATGRRGRRGRGALAALAAAVPAAEAVHVVNNGAAALVLAATALAAGREIVLARGELVEIGDGFRIPDLLVCTGARLREVGTAELATLPAPVVVDTGSGLLAPLPGLPAEPDASSALRAGAALVTASGDKLLGGPQAGLLLGRAGVVETLRRHPLARALRVDKLTLAALEATLRGPAPPTARALVADPDALRERAERLAGLLRAAGVDAVAVASEAAVGGGGAPGVPLPSAAVSLPAAYADRLRTGDPAVLGRVERGRCLLDLRAVEETDDAALRRAVLAASAVD